MKFLAQIRTLLEPIEKEEEFAAGVEPRQLRLPGRPPGTTTTGVVRWVFEHTASVLNERVLSKIAGELRLVLDAMPM